MDPSGLEWSSVTKVSELGIKIFADCADPAEISEHSQNPLVSGFTTNPTLMRAAGVEDFRSFATEALELADGKPISFEVCADEFDEMRDQALEISSWADNVFVKIPIANCRGDSSLDILSELARDGVRLNATALMTVEQVRGAADALAEARAAYISLFAGRIADTGVDPVPMIAECAEILRASPHLELIWASPREVLNVFQADQAGCHVITLTAALLGKLSLVGKDLVEFSYETVRMFYNDAQAAGYSLSTTRVTSGQ